MTDDLDRRLRDSLREAPLPSAPTSLHVALDRLELEPVPPGRPPVRRQASLALAPLLLGVVAIVAVALAGGWDRGPVAASTSPSASEPVPTPGATASPLASDGASGDLVATDRGLILAVAFDRTEVAPGGDLIIDVVIRNDRSEPVEIFVDHCGAPATMYTQVPVPVDPAGRDWDGIAGAFKTYALTEGNGPGGVPATAAGRVYATVSPCRGPASDLTLAPGESTSSSLTWTAELVNDLPALPGAVPFDVSVGHDPTGEPPSYPPDYTGPAGSWFRYYEQLSVNGVLEIAGEAPGIVTAGEALDALLADRGFAAWLAEKPKRTWSGANLFLLNYGPAQGIVPAGPNWEIDLFREMGVPRNWAIAFVDPITGELLSVTYCDIPCDR